METPKIVKHVSVTSRGIKFPWRFYNELFLNEDVGRSRNRGKTSEFPWIWLTGLSDVRPNAACLEATGHRHRCLVQALSWKRFLTERPSSQYLWKSNETEETLNTATYCTCVMIALVEGGRHGERVSHQTPGRSRAGRNCWSPTSNCSEQWAGYAAQGVAREHEQCQQKLNKHQSLTANY